MADLPVNHVAKGWHQSGGSFRARKLSSSKSLLQDPTSHVSLVQALPSLSQW